MVDTVVAKKICAEDVCVDRNQLKELLDYVRAHQDRVCRSHNKRQYLL